MGPGSLLVCEHFLFFSGGPSDAIAPLTASCRVWVSKYKPPTQVCRFACYSVLTTWLSVIRLPTCVHLSAHACVSMQSIMSHSVEEVCFWLLRNKFHHLVKDFRGMYISFKT